MYGTCSFAVAGVLVVLMATGCAGAIVAPADSPVMIDITDFALTVRNVTNGPLTDLTIGIKPTGVRPEYQAELRRLAAGEDADIPYAEFRGVDGDPLIVRNINPRSVRITATDLNGGQHDVELPWE